MKKTEITVQIFEQIDSIKSKLKKLGFLKVDNYKLLDKYFTNLKIDNGIDYQTLLKNSVIIRTVFVKNKKPFSKLLYKNKNIDNFGNVISEEKYSTKIDNVEQLETILNILNIYRWIEIEQDIECFKLDDKQISTCNVVNLGIFIEIEEYPSINNLTHEQKFEEMCKYINSFDFNIGKDYSCKKVYMLFKKLNKPQN